MSLPSALQAIRPSVFRVVIRPSDGQRTVATAFIVRPGVALTCAHAVLGVANITDLVRHVAGTESDRAVIDRLIRDYAAECLSWISVEDDEGNPVKVFGVDFDWQYDVALLRLDSNAPAIAVESSAHLPLGSDVWFCGYGYAIQTENVDWPLSVVVGHVMSRYSIVNGGYARRPFLFVQAPAFGGHSGGPVVDRRTGACIGMVNGYMQWGADGVHRTESGTQEMILDDVYVPVGVSYITAFAEIKGDCPLLRSALA